MTAGVPFYFNSYRNFVNSLVIDTHTGDISGFVGLNLSIINEKGLFDIKVGKFVDIEIVKDIEN